MALRVIGFKQSKPVATSNLLAGQFVSSSDNPIDNARFAGAVTGIVNDPQLCFGPRFLERPRTGWRSTYVVTSLDNDTRNAFKLVDIGEQLGFFEIEIIQEIARADAGEWHGFRSIREAVEQVGIRQQSCDLALPDRRW